MSKLLKLNTGTLDIEEYVFQCPGCGYSHRIRTKGPRPRWSFNGNPEKPTFTPSYLIKGYKLITQDKGVTRCHCFIEDGKIRFLDDCGHGLAGQTVELPEWDETKG